MAAVRKHRPSPDGVPNGSNRPVAAVRAIANERPGSLQGALLTLKRNRSPAMGYDAAPFALTLPDGGCPQMAKSFTLFMVIASGATR